MRNSKVILIVFLMSVSLIALLALQGHWLWSSYQLQQEEFDKDVNRALADIIDANRDNNFKKNYFLQNILPLISDSLVSALDFYKKNGSVKDDTIHFKKDGKPRKGIAISYTNVVINHDGISKLDSIFNLEKQWNLDHTFINSNKKDTVKINLALDSSANYGRMKLSELQELLMDSLSNMYDGFPNYLKNIINSTVPFSYNSRNLDSLFNANLKANNITTPYSFGIYDSIGHSFSYTNTISNSIDLKSVKGYSMGMGEGNDLYIKIYFPDKNLYIWKRMTILLLASFLIVTLITSVYIYTLNTILKQKRLSEMKSDFINNMTHEFKTPLANISLAIESTLNFSGKDDKIKTEKYLGIAKKENVRLTGLVEKILKTAAYDQEGIKLKSEKIDIHELLEKVIDSFKMQIDSKGGKIECQLNAKNSYMMGDPDHLEAVVYNLVDNAIKYTNKDPSIMISTKNEGNLLNITITDNGIGISKADQKRIFDKFYRVHTGNVHDVKGFGLGLNYVAEVIKEHNGITNVYSELNKGTTFKIHLPTTTNHGEA